MPFQTYAQEQNIKTAVVSCVQHIQTEQSVNKKKILVTFIFTETFLQEQWELQICENGVLLQQGVGKSENEDWFPILMFTRFEDFPLSFHSSS